MNEKPIRVLIVDDSAVVRAILSRELAKDPSIQVVGAAPDPFAARQKILDLQPDVLTLDVEMPKMDGITFLKALAKYHPMPVIMVSSLTHSGMQTAVDALAAGAVDVVGKPGGSTSAEGLGPMLIAKIKAAAKAKARFHDAPATKPAPAARPPLATVAHRAGSAHVIALGASTGGVQALTEVLTALPAGAPGVVVVQHMPPNFTRSFADRLARLCQIQVREAVEGDAVRPGLALIAPGGFHMMLKRDANTGAYSVGIKDGPEVHHQKPAVDVLFQSVARAAGSHAVGGLLTGMGADGAQGLLAMRRAGARTLAQDEATCVVFGMPAEAIKCGAAEATVPLGHVAMKLMQWVEAPSVPPARAAS